MKISLFEIDHYEMGYAIIKTFDFSANEITVYTNQLLYQKFQQAIPPSDSVKYCVQENTEPLEAFYERSVLLSIKNNANVYWVNTVETKLGEFAQSLSKLSCHKVLTVHNVNYWFNYSPWVFTKSYRQNKDKIRFLKTIDSLVVLSNNVKKYFSETFNPSKEVFVFPYSIYENHNPVKHTKEQLLVVPGSIDDARRNYNVILNVYSRLIADGFLLKLCLLGAPKGDYGHDVISKCSSINSTGGNILYFETEVGQKCFDDIMTLATFVVSPLQPQIRGERYGFSKETGCFFDMARYAKPGIVPHYVPAPKEQETSILSYMSEEDLAELLKFYLSDEKALDDIASKAKINAKAYSVDFLRNDEYGIVKSIQKILIQ